MRDQASDDEKCLTFADLLDGSAKNWYRQLSRSTRNKWSDLLRSFQIQYCGLGVSVAKQNYHTRRLMEEFYNQIRQWFNPTKHMDVKLGRSSGLNPIRPERSRYRIYAFVNKISVDQVSKRSDLHGNTYDLHGKRTFAMSRLRQVDEYARSEVTMSVDL
ncbi:hypothetical protein PHMEG_00022234 [Phytophthora megakarya]|uniref:Retrotransposon gag domain-containing protein n=1 Tax=Phytophthora megakarya TaxID=4795 RepID=A0A225VM90_9STRA|nr:hypothetical protein PHMEG_00022234 [Phytophthora megakarya]